MAVFKNFSAIFQCQRPVFRPWSGQFWSKSKNKKSILFASMRPIRNAIYDLRKSWMRARHFARRFAILVNHIFYKKWRPAATKFFLKIPGPLLFLYFVLEKYKNLKKIFFFSTQTTKLSIVTSAPCALGAARCTWFNGLRPLNQAGSLRPLFIFFHVRSLIIII